MNSQRNLRQIWIESTRQLDKAGIASPSLEAEVFLRFILGLERAQFLAYVDELFFSQEEYEQLQNCLKRRLAGEPLQYIIDEQEFYGHKFSLNKSVLIPRPETELLVEKALDKINKNLQINRIADLGTGSGAIAISIAMQTQKKEIWATDISLEALNVAQSNCPDNLGSKVTFLHGNYLEPLITRQLKFDLIISNPPYINTSEIAELSPTVSEYEPFLALNGGEDGLDAYRTIFNQIGQLSHKPYAALFEIGYDQGERLQNLAKSLLPSYRSEIFKDLAGLDRILELEK